MVLFTPDGWVWLEHGESAFLPVRMISQQGDKILAKASTNEQFELDIKLDYREVHPSSLQAVENMVAMEELSEAAILHNLRLRFDIDLIYTHISSILVSINPFKQLPIYSPAIMREYRDKMARMEHIAPHVYALADNAYKNLRTDNCDQSVIISGESGAGKTEATKLVLQYMAEMSGQGNDVEQQLLSSNPIIEAFGNAKTVRNNNSSRFGKWVEIRFNDRFHIVGADIKNYLLEKSRIVVPGPGERNYHIFYQLCAGCSPAEKEKWQLDHAGKFRILSIGGTLEVDGTDDADEYKQLRASFDILNFTPSEVEEIMRTTSACLHLGNVDFIANAKEEAQIKNQEELDIVADLLRVDVKALSTSLISQRKQMGRESILTVRSQLFAEAARDALTKKLYSNLFNVLIQRINKTLGAKAANSSRIVGVLDIFGFEIFNTNRFEQMCINFANEKMQQHFNSHIFEMEQKEYATEKIDVAHVSYVDNQPCLDLIENGKQSILGMADEELKLPGGSDDNLLSRMHAAHASNKYYTKPKTAVPLFTINHYAGPVEYTIEGFNDKNRDSLESNISEVIQASQSPFVASLIPVENAVRTLGSQFKSQLVALMETLNKTAPHFIRCIKSNNLKVSDTFDSQMVLRQLRYLGLKEVVNIRQLGYPIRRGHQDFVRRYGLLAGLTAKSSSDYRAGSEQILTAALPQSNAADWRVGLTKVFLRQNLSTLLESAREKKLKKIAILLQSLARTKIWRARFLKVKGAIDDLKAKMENPNSTPEELDAAISRYEGLKFKTNVILIQKAIKIRNRLFEQAQARRAVESALKTMDVETMKTAIQVAEKALLDEEMCPPFGKLKELCKAIQDARKLLETAVAAKDIAQLKAALEGSAKLGLNGPEEKKAAALCQSLEEEIRLAKKLAEEQRIREIEALKKAIQVATAAKSGVMLDAAIKKVLESKYKAELESTPLIVDAQKLVLTLEKEVKVFQLAQELKAAIESEDKAILTQTISLALEKGFQNHALTIQAKELLEKLKKKQDLLDMIMQAMASKNETAIKLTLASVSSPDNLSQFPTLTESPEFQNAKKLMEELITKKSETASAEKAAVAASTAHALDSLKMAMESRNQQLLENALAAAKAVGFSKDSTHAGSDLFNEASKMLTAITAENDTRKQELLNANASANEEKKRGVRRSMIAMGQTSLLAQSVQAETKEESSFDPKVYEKDEYELGLYPDLRSVNDFSSDNKAAKIGMLKWTKSYLPKSLSKFESQSYGYGDGATTNSAFEYSERFLSDKAVECFKMIQGFMLDRSYSFPDTLVTELFGEILLYPALRNEIYAQLMKQLSNNTEHIESYTRGWMLLCLLTDVIPPLNNFLNYLLHFIHVHVTSKHEVISQAHSQVSQNYAAYALHKLKLTCSKFKFQAPKKDSPELATATASKEAGQPMAILAPFIPLTSVEHITAFRERTMVPSLVKIHLIDGSMIETTVNPWQTNAEVVKSICDSTGIADHEYFGLFEMRGIDLLYLYANDNLLDVQLQWSKAARKEEIKKSKGFFASLFSKKEKKEDDYDEWANNPGIRRFLLKRRIYAKHVGLEVPADKTQQKVLFYAIQNELVQGLHPIDEEPAVKLATISKTLSDAGLFKPIGPLPKPPASEDSDVWGHQHPFDLPQHLEKKLDAKKFASKIEKLQLTLKDQSFELWLNDAKNLATFGCSFFNVRRVDDPSIPIKMANDLALGVNYYGVRLLDRKTRAVLDHFPLLNILGWSSSPIRFVMKVKLNKPIGSGITTVTFRFNTYNPKMGKEICDLLFSYATEMMKTVGLGK